VYGNSTSPVQSPTGAHIPHLTWANDYICVCYIGVLGGAEAWKRSMSLLTHMVYADMVKYLIIYIYLYDRDP
jgi:hypothetical protein